MYLFLFLMHVDNSKRERTSYKYINVGYFILFQTSSADEKSFTLNKTPWRWCHCPPSQRCRAGPRPTGWPTPRLFQTVGARCWRWPRGCCCSSACPAGWCGTATPPSPRSWIWRTVHIRTRSRAPWSGRGQPWGRWTRPCQGCSLPRCWAARWQTSGPQSVFGGCRPLSAWLWRLQVWLGLVQGGTNIRNFILVWPLNLIQNDLRSACCKDKGESRHIAHSQHMLLGKLGSVTRNKLIQSKFALSWVL